MHSLWSVSYCVVWSSPDDSTSHHVRFIHEGEGIWKGVEEWVMRRMIDWEGVLGCWSEGGWYLDEWVFCDACFIWLDWGGWMGWLNGESMEWFVIVRDGEWNGWIWIQRGGVSIDCYVWSAGREGLVEYEEKGEIEYRIWLEIIDGC